MKNLKKSVLQGHWRRATGGEVAWVLSLDPLSVLWGLLAAARGNPCRVKCAGPKGRAAALRHALCWLFPYISNPQMHTLHL